MSKGVNLVLRIPTKKMHEDLRRMAKEADRSLNKEIIRALEFWIRSAGNV